MTRLDIGELAIQACIKLASREFTAALGLASQVVAELAKLEQEESSLPEDAKQAIRQCESILSDCEDIPERGEDFAAGVIERVESIQGWIEENKHVTEAQESALKNMENAVARWVHR